MRAESGSCRVQNANSPARIGVIAWITRTWAMLVWFNATMKLADATAMPAATATPAGFATDLNAARRPTSSRRPGRRRPPGKRTRLARRSGRRRRRRPDAAGCRRSTTPAPRPARTPGRDDAPSTWTPLRSRFSRRSSYRRSAPVTASCSRLSRRSAATIVHAAARRAGGELDRLAPKRSCAHARGSSPPMASPPARHAHSSPRLGKFSDSSIRS